MSGIWKQVKAWASLIRIYFKPVHAESWNEIQRTIRNRFPDVRRISAGELSAWLEDAGRVAPVLIDARHEEEFQVSHLPKARHARTVKAVRAVVPSETQPIVVYCSMGYRSSSLARKLRKAGFTNVANLEGSLFGWANEGKPLHQGVEQVSAARVHPYNGKWGKLLNSELRDE
jgi:rhodanese-related sulfurtransferase